MTPAGSPPPLVTRGDVAALLGIPLDKLTWWLWGLHEHRRYDEFDIPRRVGDEPRRICAPIKPIKDLQRKLVRVLDACFTPAPNVHGYVLRRGPPTNARIHRRQEWLLRIDLENFFPSINFGRVLGVFQNYPFDYPHDVAVMLAQLCCHRNQIPQGAPTSPVISNLICRGLDKELAALAKVERCYYSRYADDICFSTDRKTFPSLLAKRNAEGVDLGEPIGNLIREHGFAVNSIKTVLLRRTQRQRVTGLIVNEKVNISRDYVRSLRNVLYTWRVHGREAAEASFARWDPERGWPPGKGAPDFALTIRGRVQHVGSVKGHGNSVYGKLAAALHEADPSFRPPRDAGLPRAQIRLFTEGETDVKHILAAQKYFTDRGEFLDFELVANSNSAAGNDSELLKRCRSLGDTAESPCVCLFDTDNPEVLKKAVGSQDWKSWGPHCIAIKLVAPDWRDDGAPICIELLFDDATLRIVEDEGRRIYLRKEFDPRTGIHLDLPDITIPNARNKTIVQEEVHDRDGESIGMSKMTFAENVANGEGPFAEVDFDGFRPTFEAMNEAVLAFGRGR